MWSLLANKFNKLSNKSGYNLKVAKSEKVTKYID